jgi:CheY-like chemotaxis protein
MVFVSPDIPRRVRGDRERLQHVLEDLMALAVKRTDRGEVVVRANMEGRSDAGLVLLGFHIRHSADPASLRPAAALGGAFGTGTSAAGNGDARLGLPITERLIDRLGGELTVERAPGPALCYQFTLPFRPARESAAAEVPLAEGLAALRVLVVDDNHTHRQILHRYLRHCDVVSDSAAGGQDALVMLQRAAAAGTPYDLAIVDFSMPGMNGFELAEAIGHSDDLAGTRLVLLTAFDELGQDVTALNAGFAAYLTKPVQYTRLLDTIRTVVEAAGPTG